MKKVAVEKGLSDVEQYLSQQGYNVQQFERNSVEKGSFYNKFDAVVVTGESMNVMGYEDTVTKVPQVVADGLTAEEVKNQLDSKMTK